VAITKVASGSAAAATDTLPAFNVGDLCLVFAFRDGSTTAPSLPAGWTNGRNNGANTCSGRSGYRFLQSGDTSIGTWTNATEVVWIILRGADVLGPDGDVLASSINSGSSTAPNWPALTVLDKNSTEWLILLGGHRTATNMNSVALSGTTNESPATGAVALHDVQGTSADWASTSKTVNANSGWITHTFQVLVAGPAHVSQVVAESVMGPTDAKARVSQVAAETVMLPTDAKARVSQVVVEMVAPQTNVGIVSQVVAEAVIQVVARPTFYVTIID
jgi:hypothetical protein